MRYRSIYLAILAMGLVHCAAASEPDGIAQTETLPDAEPDETLPEGAAAPLESDVVFERGTLEQLEETAAEMQAERSGDELVDKSCRRPTDWNADRVLAEMNMGYWPIQDPYCRDKAYCQDGTYAYGFALKSVASRGSGDDLGVTGIAVGCNNPVTGSFVHWAVPLASAQAPGSWDTQPPCSLNNPLWGGNFALADGPSGFDDVGITDGAGLCADNAVKNINVNNPTWGSWQGWRVCPYGTIVCGVADKTDPDDSGDDAGMTGVKVSCCDF